MIQIINDDGRTELVNPATIERATLERETTAETTEGESKPAEKYFLSLKFSDGRSEQVSGEQARNTWAELQALRPAVKRAKK